MSKITFITDTFNRPDSLKMMLLSLLSQQFKNWELIIINDSPNCDYSTFLEYINNLNDKRIKYYENNKNYGVNYSRNRGIDETDEETDYINFLDDDDILLPNSLQEQIDLLNDNKNWLMTLSVNKHNNSKFDHIKKSLGNKYYNYLKDYLVKRKIKGDYNQILNFKIIKNKKIRFSKKVKQAEEWVFSIRASRYMSPYVVNINTLQKEYREDGLTHLVNENKSFKNRLVDYINTIKACTEIFWEGFYPLEKIYILIKLIRGFQKLFFKY